jgi:hypothetical protein
MKRTVYLNEFKEDFRAMGMLNFSSRGLEALYFYFSDYEDETGVEIDLDVVAICCEYTEYDSLEDFQLDYNAEDYPDMDSIMNVTQVIYIDSFSFIILTF